MLRYIYADDLAYFPRLRDTMFRDRADQFKRRLGWEVKVNEAGEERDEYDAINPLYVIWQKSDGTHGGSMRFLPTTGDTMVNDHFSHINDGKRIESPFIWECTRFCLAPGADRRVTAALTVGAGEIMDEFNLRHFVGVFDPRMERIYSLMGLNPDVLGRVGEGRNTIGVGLWEMHEDVFAPTLEKAGFDRATSKRWFREAFDRSVLGDTRAIA
ncbi:acyl-homoserine-lactone synthase [Celeribacter indicus]|uniref:Acyl-homoserine-lactone synthase n=1 Tax=Celeribacter indicus TaxID=1208324 RepID=A0A0B5E597_9RHOB|nr:acyl-homoserine-lactone synthase [Celeribacter indicus]AJE48565.1 autoinducer synthesis protein Tral [Celeribacter indicus]SDX08550.1 acyl homoserine lactone synthase [Celeribacter indicus]